MPTLITRDYAVSQKRSYSGTAYASLIGSLNSNPLQEDAGMLQKHDGQLSKLRVWVTESGDSGTGSVTLWRKPDEGSWSSTALTVTITAGTDGLYEDNDHTAAFYEGDLLCWKIVPTTSFGEPFALRSIIAQVRDQP